MNITLQEFIDISPQGIPGTGTMLLIFGVQGASENAILAIKQTVMRNIQGHPLFHNDRFQKTGGQLGISTKGLGHTGELIYGGKNHPRVELREPQVILQR